MSIIPTSADQITLSSEQQSALDQVRTELLQSDEAVLVGPAGTGKTTIMREFIRQWPGRFKLMAPTGKAALRLSELTGHDTTTIHGALYKEVEELEETLPNGEKVTHPIFGKAKPPVAAGELAIVDEASMVGSDLYTTFMEQLHEGEGSVLWVGDKAQLQPVKDTWGPNLDQPTAELTQIHRQALDSPVLKLATLTRQGQSHLFDTWGDEVSYVENRPIQEAMRWALGGHDRVILTWTNKVRHIANRVARDIRGFTGNSLVAGDYILIRKNNKTIGVVNGEVRKVARVEKAYRMRHTLLEPLFVETTCGNSFFVDGQCLGPQTSSETAATHRRLAKAKSTDANLVAKAEYGYCLTTHAAQGSQWRDVRFLVCKSLRRSRDGADKQRLLYTAITRASEQFIYHIL